MRKWKDVIEKAEIVLDRIEYADNVLAYPETTLLREELTELLAGNISASSYAKIIVFLDQKERTVNAFDAKALSISEALTAEQKNKKETE